MAQPKKTEEKSAKKSKLPLVHTKTLREEQASRGEPKDVSLWRLFWRGFFSPVRLIWRGVSWLIHHPPLSTIGHGLKWFFTRRPVKFVGRFLGFRYVRDSWRELRSVTWPVRKESFRLTGAVILFAVIFGLFIAVIDFGLDKLFKQILLN